MEGAWSEGKDIRAQICTHWAFVLFQPVSIEYCFVPGTVSGSEFVGQGLREPQRSYLSPKSQGWGWGWCRRQTVLSQIGFLLCKMGTGISTPCLPGN